MELIKKYNYEDPLHMKGDPFGAADAKVAHVNQLINEVNSNTTSITSLTGRVETLENTPGEYYITGYFQILPDSTFDTTIVRHNTPISNLENCLKLYVPISAQAPCNIIIGYSNTADVGTSILLTDQTGDYAISTYEMHSINLTPTRYMVDLFSGWNLSLIDIVTSPDFNGTNYTVSEPQIAGIRTRVFVGGNVIYTAMPDANGLDGESGDFFKFELRFSKLQFEQI
jgi:hypothetical protein